MSPGGDALGRQRVGADQADATGAQDWRDGAGSDRGYRTAKLADHEDYLRELTRTRVGITLEEMKAALFEERCVAVSITAISLRLHRLGRSYKESR